jgi:hypothetical protein
MLLGIDAIGNLNGYREMDARNPGADPTFPALSSALRKGVAAAAQSIKDARLALAPLSQE